MNFFQAQDKARRRTGLLILLFAMAVLCLIGLTQLLVMVALHFGGETALTLDTTFWDAFSWVQLAEIAAAIVLVVSLASFYKVMQLRAGGPAVAEMLGGRLLDRESQDPDVRKVLNIVEEMAIASGMPVPPVYLIEDDAINAFAAGHHTHDVAIGLTRGCMTLLDRDELQGVIAHEFSHIFNGDMRINLHLIGILHGILFIGLVGRFLLDNMTRGARYSRRDNRGAGPLIVLGLGLMIIGYCGTFFGNLIKAAISRQREFLADASAVQYTRNPAGIRQALCKIGGYPLGSRMLHPRASEVSHLFFSDGMKHFFSHSLMATHPPLAERIQAIDPRWDGNFPDIALNLSAEKPAIDPASVQIVNGEVYYRHTAPTLAAITDPVPGMAVASAMAAIGVPSAEHLAQARQTLDTLPARLERLSREPYGARAVVHCLLLDPQPSAREQQWALLQHTTDAPVLSLCEQLASDTDSLPATLRLPLIDLCLPSLKTMSQAQLKQFMKAVMAQIRADQQVSLFEWALYSLLRHHLQDKPVPGQHKLASLASPCQRLLSALALASHADAAEAHAAFQQAWPQLGLPDTPLLEDALQDMAQLDQALLLLRNLQPLGKPRLLKACCQAIEQGGHYDPASIELLRAIADTLDTPIPPVIPVKAA